MSDQTNQGIVADAEVPSDLSLQPSPTHAPVITLRLSEAIRLGAMDTEPLREFYSAGGATCALGAAMHAAGVTTEAMHSKEVFKRWPLTTRQLKCPCCVSDGLGIWVVTHLNDDHKWTREQIADWVEQQEQGSTS